jgi:hypothetical protein
VLQVLSVGQGPQQRPYQQQRPGGQGGGGPYRTSQGIGVRTVPRPGPGGGPGGRPGGGTSSSDDGGFSGRRYDGGGGGDRRFGRGGERGRAPQTLVPINNDIRCAPPTASTARAATAAAACPLACSIFWSPACLCAILSCGPFRLLHPRLLLCRPAAVPLPPCRLCTGPSATLRTTNAGHRRCA